MRAVFAVALLVAPSSGSFLLAPKNGSVTGAKAVSPAVGSHKAYLDHTSLGEQVLHLAAVLGSNGNLLKTQKPVPEPQTVRYTPYTCKKLFAYKNTREACFKLQPLICGKDCQKILPEGGNVTECTKTQDMICEVPKAKEAPAATTLPNSTGSNFSTTFCNAYPTDVKINIQHDKFYAAEDPKAFIKDLKYMECRQAKIPAGERVSIYLGNHPATKHVVGGDNAIVMLGQFKLGELQVGTMVYSFKDEGYKRPVVCNAYPKAKLQTTVAGRDWHPYVSANHPRSLKYLECEKLNLDHVDSQRDPEALEFALDGKTKGHVAISPVHSFYIVGSKLDKNDTLTFEEYAFNRSTIRLAK